MVMTVFIAAVDHVSAFRCPAIIHARFSTARLRSQSNFEGPQDLALAHESERSFRLDNEDVICLDWIGFGRCSSPAQCSEGKKCARNIDLKGALHSVRIAKASSNGNYFTDTAVVWKASIAS